MSAKLDLPGISRFDPDVEQSSIGPKWQTWREELDYYIAAANITNDKQKRTYFFILQDLNSRKFLKHCMNLRKKGHSSQLVML